jgi:flagellar hook-associated protein 2
MACSAAPPQAAPAASPPAWTTTSTNGAATTARSSAPVRQQQAAGQAGHAPGRYRPELDSAYSRYLLQFTNLQALQSQMGSNLSLFDALFGNDKS